jgi:hypothetical protein
MKRGILSLDDHRELALHLYAIDNHLSAILGVANGKAPAPILDMLSSCGPLETRLQTFRSKLEGLMYKQHHLGSSDYQDIYYGPNEVSCRSVQPGFTPDASKKQTDTEPQLSHDKHVSG